MKKALVVLCFLTVFSAFLFSSVLNFIPRDASVVFVSRDNATNYENLKKVGIFGFLLRDLGIEGLISMQVETLKYVDQTFVPEHFWALIEGDIAFFAKGAFDLSALENLAMMGESALLMDETEMLDTVQSLGEDMEACLIIRPTVDPQKALHALNKLLGMNISFGVPIEDLGITLLKEGNYILVPTNQDAYISAMNAQLDSIRNDPIFAKLWAEPNWMIGYFPLGLSMDRLSGMITEMLPSELLEKSATMEYSWFTGRMDEVNSLVLTGFNKYDYHDPLLKEIMVSGGVNIRDWSRTIRTPGVLVAGMKFAQLDRLISFYGDSAKQAMYEMKDLLFMDEEEFGMLSHMIHEFIQTINGEFLMSGDLVMEGFDFGFDFHLLAGLKNQQGMKSLLEELGVPLTTAYGVDSYLIDNDEIPIFLIISEHGAALTSLSPASYMQDLSKSTPLYERIQFRQKVDRYGYNTGYSFAFVDIGELLTSLLGLPFPSSLFSQIGVDAEGNAHFMTVIR